MPAEVQGRILSARPSGAVGHTKHLRQGRRGPGSPEYEFDVVNSIEYDTVFMDFRPDTMPISDIGSAGVLDFARSAGGSTPFAKLAPTIARASDIKGVVDNTNPSSITLTGVPQFLPELNPFLEICFEMQSITFLELVVGFFDAVVGSAGDVLLDIDGPTFVASFTEAVAMCLDTEQTLKTGALVGETSEDSGTFTKANFAPTAAPFGIPTLATKVVWRIELRGDLAFAFVNGVLVAELGILPATSHGTIVGASAKPGVLLAPVMFFGARSATAKNVHIDYIYMGQERVNLLV